jgi:O-antigen ligase
MAVIRHVLACVFFFFMPFTQALTFSVGFPLKFSELALIMLAAFYIPVGRKVLLPRPVLYLLSLLFTVVTVSLVVNLFWDYPYMLRNFVTRFGYTGDTISRYVYFVLALLSFYVSVDLFLSRRDTYVRWWIYGALAGAAYSWYLTLFSALRLPVYLLPGMTPPLQKIFGPVIRCGTFVEGNMMGLYMLLSAAIAFYSKRIRTGLFLLLTVFISFSTLSIIGVFLFMGLYLWRQILRRKNLVYIVPTLLLMITATILFLRTDFYKNNIQRKLFSSSSHVTTPESYSKVDRVFSIMTAYRMGLANPVLGVGLANYSRHYDHYAERGQLSPDTYKDLLRPNTRVIPNNIYIEIWAECGIAGLALFAAFLCVLLYYARGEPTNTLFPALLCMAICFIAYPSFIMIYLWSFMALPVAEYIRRKRATATGEGQLPAPSL